MNLTLGGSDSESEKRSEQVGFKRNDHGLKIKDRLKK